MKKVILLFFIILLTGGCSKTDEKKVTVLKLGHNMTVTHPFHKAMLEFKKDVEKRSNGKLKIALYPGGVLGGNRACTELLQGGVIEMIKTDSSILESFDPVFCVFSLPYLFDNEKQFDEILFNPIILKELNNITIDRDHFVILTPFTTGTRNFYTLNKPIMKPEDLKGLKIRVMESKTQIDMMHYLGGTATPMPFSEIYTALQQGIIDGAESNPTILTIGKQGEVAKAFSFDEHGIMPDLLIISTKVWRTLTKSQQELIQEAALQCAKEYRVLWDEEIANSIEEAKTKMGVRFYYPDKKPFQEKVLPMYDNARKTPVIAKFLDIINNAKSKLQESDND